MSRVAWRVGVGGALAFVLFAAFFLAGGNEGPCRSTSDFAQSFDSSTTDFRIRDRSFPPGQGCEAVSLDGRVLGWWVYPTPLEWILVLLAGLSPFIVPPTYRWLRGFVSSVRAAS